MSDTMTSSEANGIRALIDALHQQNRADISELKDGQSELKQSVDTMNGMIKGILGVAKLIAWAIGIGVVIMGLWVSTHEIRAKVSRDFSSDSQPTQNATVPPNSTAERAKP